VPRRLRYAQRDSNAQSPDPARPGWCPTRSFLAAGNYLYEEHPSYTPPPSEGVRLGEFADVGVGVAVRLGRCPCGGLVCSRCKALVPAADVRSHVCKVATSADDPATRALIAKIGKKCPACGMFIEKNAGCSHMKCGTRAGGSNADALRNGGCAHEFNWDSLRSVRNGAPGDPFNDRQARARAPRSVPWHVLCSGADPLCFPAGQFWWRQQGPGGAVELADQRPAVIRCVRSGAVFAGTRHEDVK
jgi:hypothetical protein